MRARAGDPAVPARTQASLAVSSDGIRWSLLNASPDIRAQLQSFPALHPRPGTRDIGLDTIVLTNAELDHAIGLLMLREALSYRILTTAWVREALLSHDAAWRLLESAWGATRLETPTRLDRDSALEARLFAIPGKVPGFLHDLVSKDRGACVGVRVTDTRTGSRLVYAPGVRALDPGTRAELEAADCCFVDGTFFSEDELRALRPGAPLATAMGHLPIGGPDGSLLPLSKLPGRVLYTHLNNSNPALDANSPEAAEVARAGVEIAADGQELEV